MMIARVNKRSAILMLVVVAFVVAKITSARSMTAPRNLPSTLLIGYVSQCNGEAQEAVYNGVNVLIWSFWGIDETIHASFNLSCVQQVQDELNQQGYTDVVFLASTGGWNGGHLDDTLSAQTIYNRWVEWGGHIFDGFDFDLEGNDDMISPFNIFTVKCLDTMGEMSRLAKQDGYLVSIVPPQSYLDFETSAFSRLVNLTHPTQLWHGDFSYYGANVYAYLLAKYQDSIDLVMIQLYESYSRASYEIRVDGLAPSDYLYKYISEHAARNESYFVQFQQDHSVVGLGPQLVSVPLSKLVIGLANGWAMGSERALYLSPVDCGVAYEKLKQQHDAPRGFMFWTINNEGDNGMYLAKGLNQFLKIRNSTDDAATVVVVQ